jgi:hypothetical protein
MHIAHIALNNLGEKILTNAEAIPNSPQLSTRYHLDIHTKFLV